MTTYLKKKEREEKKTCYNKLGLKTYRMYLTYVLAIVNNVFLIPRFEGKVLLSGAR